MLVSCPECELNISDKAIACPHCGYPIQPQVKKQIKRTKSRRKLPNGFGQITEIKGLNLREPFRARITVGKDNYGKPICKLLKPKAYFKTYNDAYTALVEYNKNPYDLKDDITVYELYGKWSEEYFKTLKSPSSVRTITSAWDKCTSLYKVRVKDIRARHIKTCMELVESPGIKSRIKSLFNLMLDYAVEYELTDRNYARTFNISGDIIKDLESAKNSHISFTENELELLWKHKDEQVVSMILVQCYSGWRPQELVLLEISNVNLENWTFKGGMKTDAGTDRIVPIHEKIKELVMTAYDNSIANGSKYLFTLPDKSNFTYDKLRHRFENLVKELNINPEHRAHDGRKTFVTLAKKYKVDEYAIKKIVGHSISDLTEKVYTDRDSDWLKHEIAKIK